jgi:hypothetical protein
MVRLAIDLPQAAIFAPQVDATVSMPQFALAADRRCITWRMTRN